MVKCHQPPPILPRRRGSDTLASNIIVSSRLIISGLSIAIVTVPPLRGRLAEGWYNCLKKSLTKHSNLFLPFGKVRMGYPTWNVRMGLRPRVGADAIRLVLIFCHYTCGLSLDMFARWWRTPSSLHRFLSRFWASTLPKWGKHVTQQGQARCPTWAHFLLLSCPKSSLFHHTNIFLCFYCKG